MLVTLEEAVRLLRDGKVVAIPTETVYGLAADASRDEALTSLYQTKGRPADHPVILHVEDASMAECYLTHISEPARALMEAFWPGPLTLLLPRSHRVSPRITGGRPLVGVRAPASPLALELLRRLGRPFVAPSANRFGHISPTTAQHVEDEFEGRVPVLDGGPCQVGVESTIVEVEDDRMVLLRPGQLARRDIERVAGLPVTDPEVAPTEGVPGSLKSHYAPRQPVSLVLAGELAQVLEPTSTAILAITQSGWAEARLVVRMPGNADDYARALYGALRQAEGSGCSRILVEWPPQGEEWRAVRDRLQRAAARD